MDLWPTQTGVVTFFGSLERAVTCTSSSPISCCLEFWWAMSARSIIWTSDNTYSLLEIPVEILNHIIICRRIGVYSSPVLEGTLYASKGLEVRFGLMSSLRNEEWLSMINLILRETRVHSRSPALSPSKSVCTTYLSQWTNPKSYGQPSYVVYAVTTIVHVGRTMKSYIFPLSTPSKLKL